MITHCHVKRETYEHKDLTILMAREDELRKSDFYFGREISQNKDLFKILKSVQKIINNHKCDLIEGNGNPLQCSCLENPRDGKPGGLLSVGSHRVGHN